MNDEIPIKMPHLRIPIYQKFEFLDNLHTTKYIFSESPTPQEPQLYFMIYSR